MRILSRCPFSSAPTTDREFLKVLMIMFRNTRTWQLRLVDITRAFTQSERLSVAGRYGLIVPSYIVLAATQTWSGSLLTNKKANLMEVGPLLWRVLLAQRTSLLKLVC